MGSKLSPPSLDREQDRADKQGNQLLRGKGRAWVLNDLLASLVVFLVAVPLALGIVLASGVPSVLPGLIACAVGGIVVGLLGGSRISVSGSAAGMTLLVFELVRHYGWQMTCGITLIAGLMQIGLGQLRIARTCLAITPAVIHGLMAGIGVVVSLSALPLMCGGVVAGSLSNNLVAARMLLVHWHPYSVGLALLTLVLIGAWQLVPDRWKLVPGSLVAVVAATLVYYLTNWPVQCVSLAMGSGYALTAPRFPLYRLEEWSGFLLSALTMALLASVETLLSTRAIERLLNGERADLDRELMAQGLANVISGGIGGLPVTGVIVRSATNLNAGARTRLSAILYGVWMLLFISYAQHSVERIPLPPLGSLLFYIGLRLINLRELRAMVRQRQAAVALITLVSVVVFGLLAGAAIGIGLAMLMLLRDMTRAQVTVAERDGRWHVRIEGSVTFVIVPEMTAQLSRIPDGAHVDVDLLVDLMDHAAFEALHRWRLGYQIRGGTVDIDEVHERWYQSAEEGQPIDPRKQREGGFALFRSAFRRQKRHDMAELAQGVAEFNATAPRVAGPLFEQLAREGQNPTVLFITCADSRVVPDLITGTEPGHLFTVRNIGNMVPPHDPYLEGRGTCYDPATVAALEYAVEVLQIKNIVVCGHSQCGAMQALLTAPTARHLPPGLTSWLRHGDAMLENLKPSQPGTPEDAYTLAQRNVIVQLENLRTYPMVQKRLSQGDLSVWGWFFDIEQTQLLAYVSKEQCFEAIDAGLARTHLKPT